MQKTLKTFAMASAAVLIAASANAVIFDADVTPDVIFGSGNANGSFTVDRNNGIELGLRGKLRFDENNQPQNTFNSNGDGTYTFQAGAAPGGFSFDPNSPTTPVWSFEWSINSNFDGTGGNLDNFTYLLELDGDPGPGTNFLFFDPINLPFADHAIGDNSTGNGQGTVADDATEYASLINANNVAQQSWNYEFFNLDGTALAAFDPNVIGTYTIRLSAFDGENLLAQTSIDISTVPVPAALPLMASALVGLGVVAWRRRRAA